MMSSINHNWKGAPTLKNKLSDLNNHLFEELERLNDEDLDEKQLGFEINRSKAMTNIAKSIIDNANIALEAKKHFDNMGIASAVPEILQSQKQIGSGNNEA